MAATSTIYRVHVKNWEKYNGGKKPGHQAVMVSTRFLEDAKVMTLTPGCKLLLLMCILHAPEMGRGCIELSTDMITSCTRLRAGMIPTCFKQLQDLQLLTCEIWDSLLKRKEEKGIEATPQLALVPDGPSTPKVNQNEICVIERAEDFSILLEQKHFDNWAKIYEIPYMKMELVKMTSWLLTNPSKNRKTRRGLTQFVGNWFNRGWDRYLNSQKSNGGGGGEHRSSFTGVADV